MNPPISPATVPADSSAPATPPRPGGRPTAADFLARHRGGGLFTETVNQRIGSYLAVAAHRLRLAPSALTLINLVLGLAASIAVVVLAPAAARDDVPAWALGLGALLLWQLAYSLDCSDGQLARVTGMAGPAGARVDILCDVAVQISLVAAISATALAHAPETPIWLVAVFAGTWMINLVTSVLASSNTASASLMTSTSLPVRIVKLVRDYGAVVTVCGVVIAFVPGLTPWLMAAFTVVNGLFLLASIGQSARKAGLVAPPHDPR
ncbi:CDP-alcohol phosphatidyltransferase family protein [Cryptosporangium sp. NPDC048952]|uniref:CDP-alcohol phosphatidyltransferase family protein n=1 Tax=Cryptosporangium sp. NPDC048952 TaxID=3363961 RepID=UPI003710DE57